MADLAEMTRLWQLGAGANTAAGAGNIPPAFTALLSGITGGSLSIKSMNTTLGLTDRQGLMGATIGGLGSAFQTQGGAVFKAMAAAANDLSQMTKGEWQKLQQAAQSIGSSITAAVGEINGPGGVGSFVGMLNNRAMQGQPVAGMAM